jgi:hypothetical protein
LFTFHCPPESGLLWVNKGSHFAVINGRTGTSVTKNIEGVSSVCRLFYAGACEGQMPEILTMIQIKKLTPTPAVLCMVCVVFSSAVEHHYSILSCLLLDMSQFLTWMWLLMCPASLQRVHKHLSITRHFGIKFKYKNQYICNGL